MINFHPNPSNLKKLYSMEYGFIYQNKVYKIRGQSYKTITQKTKYNYNKREEESKNIGNKNIFIAEYALEAE